MLVLTGRQAAHLATNTTVESVGLRWLALAYFSSNISTVWPGTCTAAQPPASQLKHIWQALKAHFTITNQQRLQTSVPQQLSNNTCTYSTVCVPRHKLYKSGEECCTWILLHTFSPVKYGSSCSLVHLGCTANKEANLGPGADGKRRAGR